MRRRYKVLLCIITVISLLLWWRVEFYNEKTGYEEVAVEADSRTFTASFDRIYYIAVSNEDIDLLDKMESEKAILEIDFYDSDGNAIGSCSSDGISIHTNGFTSTENSNFTNMPIELQPGKKYSLDYRCTLEDGTEANDLSFMLYGTEKNSNKYTLMLFIIAAVIICIGISQIGGQSIASKRKFFFIWTGLIILNMFMMPALQSDQENTAFANVYAYSNRLLEKEICDENGNVYIDESGIRNIGYTSYSTPLLRFWTDWSDGNCRAKLVACSNYRESDNISIDVLTIPSVLAVTMTRIVNAPYQIVLISGWIINSLITSGILVGILKLLSKYKYVNGFIELVFIMPSVLISAMSYSAFGIFIALVALLIVLLIVNEKIKTSVIVAGVIAAVSLLGKVDLFAVSKMNVGKFTFTLVNTLLSDFDRLLNEFVVYNYLGYDNVFIAVYIMIGILVVIKAGADSEITKMGKQTIAIKPGMILILWILTFIIYSVFVGIDISDPAMGSRFLLTGAMFIPIILIPCNARKSMRIINLTINNILKIVFLVCSIVVVIARYSNF